MPTANKCPRCRCGIDNDGDGNCGVCARLTDVEVREVVTALILGELWQQHFAGSTKNQIADILFDKFFS